MTINTNKGKHLALFMPSLRGGGAERVMLTLAERFSAEGHKVDIVVAKAEGPYLSEVPRCIKLVNLNVRRMAFAIIPLVKYLRQNKPVALLSTVSNANIVAVISILISKISIKVVIRESSTLSYNNGKHKGISEKFMPYFIKVFYPMADNIIAVSRGAAEDMKNTIGLPGEKISVIYNPVATEKLYIKANEKLYHPWFENSQPPVVIGVGRLSKEKGFDVLIKAIARLRKQIHVRLLILGEGSERQKLQTLINENNLKNDVSMPGFVENPFPHIKRAAVFVLASRWEGLPNTLIQALALGTPVVACNCRSGPNEILDSGKWGILVEVDNFVQISESILTHLHEPNRINKEQAINFCIENFNENYIAKSYLKLLISEDVKTF